MTTNEPVDEVATVEYGRFARYYDAYNRAIGKDAEAEATSVLELLREQGITARALLDVACGTGRHLAVFRAQVPDVVGSDVSTGMLDVAAERLPGVPLHQADFRTLQLDRTFDVVTCLFSSIGHVQDAADLDRAVRAMAGHVGHAGALVVEPWLTPEVLVEDGVRSASAVEVDDVALSRTSRSWVEEGVVVLDWVWSLATRDDIETVRERLRMPVFTRQQYLDALARAGLDGTWHELPEFPRGLVVGRRASQRAA